MSAFDPKRTIAYRSPDPFSVHLRVDTMPLPTLGATMRRRECITLVGGAAGWPLAALAQRSDRTWKIGVIMGFPESDPQARPRVNAFLAALKELGWSDRDNIKMDFRWATGEANRIRAAA